MLGHDWSGHGDIRSGRAALPMRYSTDGQRTDHALRAIRMLADEALRSMSMQLERLYSTTGRLSIPPEQLPRALLFQVLSRIRSERLLMEELGYSPLFPCFLGLNRTTRSGIGRRFEGIGTGCRPVRLRRPCSTRISCQARAAGLPSEEHFTVYGHALRACERLCDDTHRSTNDGDQRGQRQAECTRRPRRAVVPLPRGLQTVFRVARSR